MGSGINIRRAIKKHGIENFKKEILFVFETEDEMNAKEAELVTEDLIASGTVYNLCPGGNGGWGFINNNEEIRVAKNKKAAAIANSKGAYKKGRAKANEKMKYLLENDETYSSEFSKKVSLGLSKIPRKVCPTCGMQNLTPGTYSRHTKKCFS
ncbi:MAG: hypothetical protein WAQ27_03460 [Candidatus Microsaccharimonas sp.]